MAYSIKCVKKCICHLCQNKGVWDVKRKSTETALDIVEIVYDMLARVAAKKFHHRNLGVENVEQKLHD